MKSLAAGSIILMAVLLADPASDGSQEEVGPRAGYAVAVQSDEAWHDGYVRGVVGGVHDLGGPQGGPGGACKACHIPHIQAVRPTSQPTSQPSLELYRIAGQRRVFRPDEYMPGPSSLLCLGCHDGTIATSTIGSSHALLAGVRAGFAVPDGFVWRDHPIGVPYPNDRQNFRPASHVLKGGKIPLPEGRIECISCHDPHNEEGIKGLLVMSNRRSALCLTCHIK